MKRVAWVTTFRRHLLPALSGYHSKNGGSRFLKKVGVPQQSYHEDCKSKLFRILPYSVLIRGVSWPKTDVSGLNIGPTFKNQDGIDK
jgi:hypothetical protein